MTDETPAAFRMPRGLLALLVAARLAMVAAYPVLVAHVPQWAWANNDGYDAIAANWMETGAYSLEPGVPTALRLPLYPALIALVRFAAGPAYPGAVMLLQAALSVGAGILLFRLTARLFGRRVAALAAALFIVHPQVNNFVIRCATETTFIFLAMAFVYEATRFVQTRRGRHLVGGAAAMGLSLLTRPTLAPLAGICLPVLLGWSFAGRRETGRRLGWTAAATGTTLLILAPWLVRNGMRTGGEWVLQTWVGQPMCQGVYVTRHLDEFLDGRKTLTQLDQDCLTDIRLLDRRLSRTLPADVVGISREVASDRYFRKRARLLADRPFGGRARQLGRNLLWAPVLQMTWRGTRILMPLNWPLLAFGLWGVAVAFGKDPRAWMERLPALVAFGYLYGGHAATWPQARYVLPGLVPFLAFSALGMAAVFNAWRPRDPAKRERRPASI